MRPSPGSGRGWDREQPLNQPKLSPEARLDVLNAANYLSSASSNPAVGARWLNDIGNAFTLLAERRRIGRERPEIGRGLRSLVHGNYTILYRLDDGQLAIVRVLHHRQDIDKAFGLTGG